MSSKKDKLYLNLALNLARNMEGLTGTNPSVGSVLVKNDEIISLASTGYNGTPHSEFRLLNKIDKKKTKGSSLYVTLEPCSHYGKTPPCTNIIIDKKISRLVYGAHDIDERSSKRAKQILKSKKIKVKNINVPKINEFYKPYIFQRKYKQPYIVGKIACSKDFFIKSSKSKYVSNTYTQSFSHHLRYKNQAILVTYKTINEDNPLLDCRLSGLNEYSPIKVILDKNLKVKKNANIFKFKNTKIIIFYNSGDKNKIKFLKSKKAKLINVNLQKNGEFDLKKVMSILYQNNIRFLLVEGGNQFTNKMLDKNLFNEFYLIKTDNKLRQSGKLNIKKIVYKLSKKFRIKSNINQYFDKNRITRFI